MPKGIDDQQNDMNMAKVAKELRARLEKEQLKPGQTIYTMRTDPIKERIYIDARAACDQKFSAVATIHFINAEVPVIEIAFPLGIRGVKKIISMFEGWQTIQKRKDEDDSHLKDNLP